MGSTSRTEPARHGHPACDGAGDRRAAIGGGRAAERGAVLPTVAICLVVIILGAAFAVDTGRTTLAASRSRTIADLAALDAARQLDGRTAAQQIVAITAAARASAARNGSIDGESIEVHLGVAGTSNADGTTDYRRLDLADPTDAGTVPNAVEVIAAKEVDFHFIGGSATPARPAIAVLSGSSSGITGLRVSSQVANLDADRSVLNGLLAALGTGVQLQAVAYDTLANTNVSLLGVLLRLRAGPGALEETLNGTYSLATVVGALVEELGDVPGLEVLNQLVLAPAAQCLNAGTPQQSGGCIRPGDFIDGSLDGLPIDGLGISALEFLRTFLMSGMVGEAVNLALNAQLGNLVVTQVQARITAPPVIAIGGEGITASTSQVELRITPSALPGGLLALPIFAVAGGATATVTSIVCDGGEVPSSVTFDAATLGARAGIGTLPMPAPNQVWDPITAPVGWAHALSIPIKVPLVLTTIDLIVGVDLRLDVKAFADQVAGNVVTPQQVGTPPRPAYSGTPPVQLGFGAAAMRLANPDPNALGAMIELQVPEQGLGSLLGTVLNPVLNLAGGIVNNVVVPLIAPILTDLLVPVLGSLGATVGGADVSVFDATCGQRNARLVLAR